MAHWRSRLAVVLNHVHLQSKPCGERNYVTGNGTKLSNEPEAHVTIPAIRDALQQVKWSMDIYIINETTAAIKHPGLTFPDIDRNGTPRFQNCISIMADSSLHLGQPIDATGRTYLDYAKLYEENRDYMIALRAEGMKELYDKQARKSPLNLLYELSNISTRSTTAKTSMYADDGTLLLQLFTWRLYVNSKTRQPRLLPTWWVDRYSKFISESDKQPAVKKFSRPLSVKGSYKVNITWSDTDFNNHVNYSVYANICTNAAHHFVSKRLYPTITDSVLARGIQFMECLFLGETSFNDTLEIVSWEDDERTLRFDVTNKGQSVFQLTSVYFGT